MGRACSRDSDSWSLALTQKLLSRAKYTTTGTYAGNTNVRIDLMTDGLTVDREDETWKIVGAFVIVCALLPALISHRRGRCRGLLAHDGR
jgi:hypothetical protein